MTCDLKRRHLLSAAALPLFAPIARAAAGPAELADLDILEAVLRQLHPGLTRYQSEAAFSAGLHRLRQAWAAAAPGPEGDAPRLLALHRLTSSLRCGHSYPNYYNQRGRVKEQLINGWPRLPLQFRLIGERVFVTGAHASAAVPVGAELLRLDGRPIAEVLRTLVPWVRGDGSNDGARLALLMPQGDDALETFDILYPLVFGARPSFDVQWRHAGRTQRADLRGLSAAERLTQQRAPMSEPSDANPPWPLVRRGDQAVLTMPGWAMYRTQWDWRAYLNRVMDQLVAEKVRHLVVDLRGNEGGLDCGDALLARCIQQPVRLGGYEGRLRYQRVPAELKPYLETWDRRFADWGDEVEPLSGALAGWWRRRGEEAFIEPKGPRFTGRLSVLVDGSNHSATFRFAQIVRQERRGRLVGGPTGGNQRGSNGSAFFFLYLPASGLEVDVPLVGRYALTDKPDGGLAPDLAVAPRAEDLARGFDRVLATALA